ncbi:MAG: glycosyltransferase [Planctomycetota bacterium]|nr:glycosyltransferase [Planctomycetota bacterium]
MRVLMLGWEFPPFISGGLGTACYGLTRALDRMGHQVTFVLPKAVDRSVASHVALVSPDRETEAKLIAEQRGSAAAASGVHFRMEGFRSTEFVGIPATRVNPYSASGPVGEEPAAPRASDAEKAALRAAGIWVGEDDPWLAPLDPAEARALAARSDYHGDVIGDSQRYAKLVVQMCRGMTFDVIHAHDWMTYPAGMALAALTGKPLIAHIHSTEFDRSGEHVHQRVYDIERRGMHAAVRVIAVSNYTKSVCTSRYSLDPEKVEVVYNGVEHGPQPTDEDQIESRDRIVLFLGRITMQKGPEYFVAAAKRVLEKIENVKFIVAGSGDMARRMIELAAEMGIGHKILFAGFLRGRDVARVFRMADCYVMPSVSEPFGIAPLEAMSHDVPVIISKQSGVSEVLTHALKVDFWDVNEMANKIIAVLRHPPLSQTLREHGKFELRRLTWDGAAQKCIDVYAQASEAMKDRYLMARA